MPCTPLPLVPVAVPRTPSPKDARGLPHAVNAEALASLLPITPTPFVLLPITPTPFVLPPNMPVPSTLEPTTPMPPSPMLAMPCTP